MGCPAASRAVATYRPRRPRASPLWQPLDRYFDEFQRTYDERYQRRYGFWRPVVARTVEKFPLHDATVTPGRSPPATQA